MKLGKTTVVRTYLLLMLSSTLATSFIWGVNTLFLLDAGLNNLQAFAANAFFTAGQVLFEVPTGVVADTRGRRTSYLLGTVTLLITTVLYLLLWQYHAPFWQWAVVSALLGLGFTFFSGATEAWLVDALKATGYTKPLEAVFAKGQVVSGIAMLSGSVAGGFIAQATNLGVPYILRAVMLLIATAVAVVLMRDIGFKPERSAHPLKAVRNTLRLSLRHGFGNKPVRWLMLAAPFTWGVSVYAFYAMQPYLLQLWGDPNAYGVAGLAASVVAGAQIGGGLLAPQLRHLFSKRTTLLGTGIVTSTIVLIVIGLTSNFYIAVAMLVIWAIVFTASMPARQTYINGLIPSSQRATVLSFDNLMGSSGGVITQPALGRTADVYGYPVTYVISGVVQFMALPLTLLARREHAKSDSIKDFKPEDIPAAPEA